MSLAYQYQRAIDAAATFREAAATAIENDRELWPSAAYELNAISFALEHAINTLTTRRNRLMPDAADATISTAPLRA